MELLLQHLIQLMAKFLDLSGELIRQAELFRVTSLVGFRDSPAAA
jgi:hypothetical protein